MPRALDPAMQDALSNGTISPAILVELTFRSGIQYVWTGVGNLIYDAKTYTGLGSLASIGAISEGVEVKADGTTIGLSGIDPALFGDSMEDIQLGSPAKVYFALLTNGVVIGAPYLIFSGQVDKPTVTTGAEAITINLALESRMSNLQRASQRRYTSADQRAHYPDDTGFVWVERMNDLALVWGS